MGEAATKAGQPEPEGARRNEPAVCVDRRGHSAHREVQQVPVSASAQLWSQALGPSSRPQRYHHLQDKVNWNYRRTQGSFWTHLSFPCYPVPLTWESPGFLNGPISLAKEGTQLAILLLTRTQLPRPMKLGAVLLESSHQF